MYVLYLYVLLYYRRIYLDSKTSQFAIEFYWFEMPSRQFLCADLDMTIPSWTNIFRSHRF